MSIEVMKQALDALTATMSTHGFAEYIEEAKEKAITSLRQAIEVYESAPPQRPRNLREEMIEAMKQDFETWWYNEGSKGLNSCDPCDLEEHCKRMCEIAWSNGAYKAIADAEEKNA